MGAALDIDWSSLRAAAVALRNVRAAARQAAKHLPKAEQTRFVETVAKRAQREEWLPKADLAVQTLSKEDKITSGAMSCPVLSGSALLSELEPDSRLKLAVAGNNAVTHLSKMDKKDIVKHTQPLLNAAKVLSTAHGWGNEGPRSGPLVSLSFAAGSAAHEQVLDQVKLIEPTE